MNFYTCLILSNSDLRCNHIAECVMEQDFSVVKARKVIEFIHLYGFYKPECIVIDYESFGGDMLLDAMLESGKGFLKDVILVNGEKVGNLTSVSMKDLSSAILARKKRISEMKLINISQRDIEKASSIVRQKLLDLGMIPKYNGFYMLVDIVVFTCMESGKCPTLHKMILPAVAHNYDTTVTNLTQCVRKMLACRKPNSTFPYEKSTLKQTVKYVSELVRDDLYALMYTDDKERDTQAGA